MENKLSFNKRISLVKKEVFEGVTSSGELDNIKGSNTTGFYSLSTIDKYLHPCLDKYDLDLDLWIEKTKIVGIWYDCESDKTREVIVDFSRIENIGKLQLMANEVMSEGAVKSYTRRYALTSILMLPSTDLIENMAQPKKPQQNTQPTQPVKPVMTEKEIEILNKIKNICYLVADKNEKEMIKVLEQQSSFMTSDGKQISGLKDFNKLNGKRLMTVYGQLQKSFPETYQKVKETFDNRKNKTGA
jgi:hypothetical protein